MRRWITVPTILTICLVQTIYATAQETGAWYASAETLVLDRNNTFGDPLVLDEDNFPEPVLTGDDLNFDFEAGTKFTIGRVATNGAAIEAVYFGRNDWMAEASALGDNNRSIPGDLGLATFDYFAVDRIDVSYGSQIDNLEVNYIRHFSNLRLLAGFRYFELDESLQIASFDADTFLSDYLIDTQNRLYGGQIGAAYGIMGTTRFDRQWEINTGLKLGVFGNANQQSTLVRDLNNNLVYRDLTVEGDGTSFIGQIDIKGSVNLWKHLDLVIGYNLLWVESVALAPYQLDFTDTLDSSNFVNDTPGVFFHGLSIGLSGTW